MVGPTRATKRTPHPARPSKAALAPCLAAAATLAASASVAAPPALAAQAPGDTLAVQTDHLSVHLDRATGAIELRVLDDAGGLAHSAQVRGLLLDGVRQAGYTATGGRTVPGQDEQDGALGQPLPGQGPEGAPATSVTARTADLDVSLDVVGPRAIAVTWSTRDGARRDFALELISDDWTSYYGTGERFNALDQRGYTLPIITDDRYGNKGTGSHKPVPFVMSSQGFGVWIDSWAPGSFDLAATERFLSVLRFPEHRFRAVFIGGPTMPDVLEGYTALTGRSPVPPPWAFGLWKSRDIHHNADSVYTDIRKLREHGIPSSVLVIDSPWETGYNTFVVNREQFPDPDGMFGDIREAGFEICLWLTPFINNRNVQDVPGIDLVSANFDDAARAGHLVEHADGRVALMDWWKGVGGLVDFTDPAANAYWRELLLQTRQYDVKAFKVDDGEGNFVPDAVFADGSSALEMKNRYSILYDSVMQAYVDEELDGEGVLIVRSGYTGVQRFPFSWAGDNRGTFDFDDGLPSVILAGQNAAMSGISLWGHDIAGYAGTPTKEVFIRWTQFGAFSPFMQVHMTSNLGPWDFDRETLDIFTRFTRIRTRLFPYLYDAVHESARTGLPIIRPMALAFPDDEHAAHRIYQYMFGPDLLVAPVYQPVTYRSVYLPDGGWVDWWTGEVHQGPTTVEVHAPLDRMPLFVRAGAILPQIPGDVETLVPRHPEMAEELVALDDRRVLEVWPGGDGAVDTHEGLSAELTTAAGRTTLRVASETPRPVEVRLRDRTLPDLRVPGATVTVDDEAGATVIAFPSLDGTATIAWEER